MMTVSLYAADNEIYLDQSGTTLNLDIEQLGISNIIGGLNSSAGSLTAFDIDGTSMTIDINMIGNTNKFLGDIWADNFTALYNFTGNTNTFTIQVDPTNTYGADSSNQNIAVTGSSNTFTLNQGTTALAMAARRHRGSSACGSDSNTDSPEQTALPDQISLERLTR